MSDQTKRLAAVTTGCVGFVDRHLRTIEHPIAQDLIRVIVKGSQKADTNLGKVLEVGIGDLSCRAVVFDEILVVLVIRSRELRERTKILGRTRIRF